MILNVLENTKGPSPCVLCVLGGQTSGAGDRDLPVTALVQVRRADVRA